MGAVGRSSSGGRPALALRSGTDHDVIVVGGGHNGLVTAAYLARAGLRTLVVEARSIVGGTAASERFAGALVNVCNCDHTTFRTTPVTEDLGLAEHGLRYIDMEPSGIAASWTGGAAWQHHHDVGRTMDELAATYPDEVDGYRRYLRAARPAVELILRAASEPPSIGGLTRLAARRRLAGVPTVLRWSRRSAADVLRSFFHHEAVIGAGPRHRPDGVGHLPGDPADRVGRGVVRHPPRRPASDGRSAAAAR